MHEINPNEIGILLRTLKFEDVMEAMQKHFGDQKKDHPGYRKVWDRLLSMQPVTTEYVCEVYPMEDEGDTWFELSGVARDGEYHCIMFRSWNEWLSMVLRGSENCHLNQNELMAHALFEMTYFGFDESDVEKVWEDFTGSFEEFNETLDLSDD